MVLYAVQVAFRFNQFVLSITDSKRIFKAFPSFSDNCFEISLDLGFNYQLSYDLLEKSAAQQGLLRGEEMGR
jgi:hypothetical protein